MDSLQRLLLFFFKSNDIPNCRCICTNCNPDNCTSCNVMQIAETDLLYSSSTDDSRKAIKFSVDLKCCHENDKNKENVEICTIMLKVTLSRWTTIFSQSAI